MKLKPYPKYKDSGVQWIGVIPEKWNTKRIKDKLKFEIGGTPSTGREDYFDGNNLWVSIADMNNNLIITETKNMISQEGIINSNVKKIPKGSLLFSFKLSVGYVSFAGKDLYTNEAIASFIPNKNVDLNFLRYVLVQDFQENGYENIYGAKLFNKDLIGFSKFVLPETIEEQKKIASFIDKKNDKLNQTIEKDKQLIELLKEKRTALINHVVTKGLDKNAKMKNSGIDFIDEIPEHWEINKLTNFIDLKHGHQFREEDFVDEGLKIVKIGQLKDEGIIDLSNCSFIDEDRKREFRSVLLKEGDVLMALSGATVGKVARIDFPIKDTFQNYRVGNFLSLGKMDKHFIYYILLSNLFNFQMYLYIAQTAQENIGKKDFKKIIITIPPTEEQTQIVQYLDKETSKIDKTIKKIEEKINLMEEYKKSLIHHVVTGKVDVRGEK